MPTHLGVPASSIVTLRASHGSEEFRRIYPDGQEGPRGWRVPDLRCLVITDVVFTAVTDRLGGRRDPSFSIWLTGARTALVFQQALVVPADLPITTTTYVTVATTLTSGFVVGPGGRLTFGDASFGSAEVYGYLCDDAPAVVEASDAPVDVVAADALTARVSHKIKRP